MKAAKRTELFLPDALKTGKTEPQGEPSTTKDPVDSLVERIKQLEGTIVRLNKLIYAKNLIDEYKINKKPSSKLNGKTKKRVKASKISKRKQSLNWISHGR